MRLLPHPATVAWRLFLSYLVVVSSGLWSWQHKKRSSSWCRRRLNRHVAQMQAGWARPRRWRPICTPTSTPRQRGPGAIRPGGGSRGPCFGACSPPGDRRARPGDDARQPAPGRGRLPPAGRGAFPDELGPWPRLSTHGRDPRADRAAAGWSSSADVAHELRTRSAPCRGSWRAWRTGPAGRAGHLSQRRASRSTGFRGWCMISRAVARGGRPDPYRAPAHRPGRPGSRRDRSPSSSISRTGGRLQVSVAAGLPLCRPTRTGSPRSCSTLVGNALQYTRLAARLPVRARRDAREAVVAVTGHGAGIHSKHLPHVFGAFLSRRQVAFACRRRSGIGLTIAKTPGPRLTAGVSGDSPGPAGKHLHLHPPPRTLIPRSQLLRPVLCHTREGGCPAVAPWIPAPISMRRAFAGMTS